MVFSPGEPLFSDLRIPAASCNRLQKIIAWTTKCQSKIGAENQGIG
jgi:hypothetical protein